jgi:membrane-associated protein
MFDISVLFTGYLSSFALFIFVFLSGFIPFPAIEAIVVSYATFAPSFKGLIFLMLLVYLASIAGDTFTYFIAKKFSERLRNKLLKFKWYNKNEIRNKRYLDKNGFWFVFLSRFAVPGSCIVVSYISGFERLNFKKFIWGVVFGELIYAIIFPLIGYLFQHTWKELINFIQYILIGIVILIIAIYIIVKLVKRYNKIKSNNKSQ